VSIICESDGIMAKPTNDNGKIANGSNREICCFATLKFGCLLLCHPVSMTGGTICVYDLWVRWHNGEAHK
jgi:hypothetical protein